MSILINIHAPLKYAKILMFYGELSGKKKFDLCLLYKDVCRNE